MISWIFLFLLALVQGVSQPSLSLIASAFSNSVTIGLALYLLGKEPTWKRAVYGAFIWFFASQLIQFYWLTSHPYVYIYLVWILGSALYALPFALLCHLLYKRSLTFLELLALAGGWTLLEWGRLFILSGITWNPLGLSLSGFDHARQIASWVGVYGLSFLVIATNLSFLWFLQKKRWNLFFLWFFLALFPYVLGQSVLEARLKERQKVEVKRVKVALVQTGFPANGGAGFSFHEMTQLAWKQWEIIVSLASSIEKEEVDLLVLPEFVIPFPRTFYLYPYEHVEKLFRDKFSSLASLPLVGEDEGKNFEIGEEKILFVTNGYMMRALSSRLGVPVVCGMEEMVAKEKERNFHSSAFYLDHAKGEICRYDKRVLVPMGEYIPFSFLRTLASFYQIGGSFTPGTKAKVITHAKAKIGLCICYEETFGNLLRENKRLGADLLVSLTSDVWYPNSMLPWQHFDHARLRTVELGVPLVRSCNTGVTASLDSLGRIEAVLGDGINDQFTPGVLVTKPVLYTYPTFYSSFGDMPVVLASLLFIGMALYKRKGV